jgi:hypothetical protein
MTQMTQLLQWALDDLSYVKPNGPPDQLTAAGGLYGPRFVITTVLILVFVHLTSIDV